MRQPRQERLSGQSSHAVSSETTTVGDPASGQRAHLGSTTRNGRPSVSSFLVTQFSLSQDFPTNIGILKADFSHRGVNFWGSHRGFLTRKGAGFNPRQRPQPKLWSSLQHTLGRPLQSPISPRHLRHLSDPPLRRDDRSTRLAHVAKAH